MLSIHDTVMILKHMHYFSQGVYYSSLLDVLEQTFWQTPSASGPLSIASSVRVAKIIAGNQIKFLPFEQSLYCSSDLLPLKINKT